MFLNCFFVIYEFGLSFVVTLVLFLVSYEIMCETVDKFVQNAIKLRMKMGLPEKELVIKSEEGIAFIMLYMCAFETALYLLKYPYLTRFVFQFPKKARNQTLKRSSLV